MDTQAADGILQASQCIHVLLQGGAPWGFTLKGGLEHGEPLIISKIEDGGKASMSEKMEVGDELVNINGTPLYGSRQEALILIKGSYKILKMIVRRRNVSIVRPHSWHLAKLSEVHPDVASMQYPMDAFSLSWHSGCENSELPMQWNPLSRHCSTDKSSSIGSMESLDQPGQNYYEGTLSPIDPGMYQNKRDSAYSSFSASSNASDYTVFAKTEESSPMDPILQGLGNSKQSDGRYLQTGQGTGDPQGELSNLTLVENSQRPSSFPYDGNHLAVIKSPQPPVRRDSLRVSKNQLNHCEKRRASAPGDSLQMSGRLPLENEQHNNLETVRCRCGLGLCTVHLKESLLSDQYYMLSSQSDRAPLCNDKTAAIDKEQQNHCTKTQQGWSGENKEHRLFNCNEAREGIQCTVQQVKDTLPNLNCPLRKSSSNKEHSSIQTEFASDVWDMAQSQEGIIFPKSQCNGESPKENICNNLRDSETSQADSLTILNSLQKTEGQLRVSSETCVRKPNKISNTHQTFQQQHSTVFLRQPNNSDTPLEGSQKPEESQVPAKKPGSSRHRSAQMRRRSDRFATNLRNEIQRRKAQLQKSQGSVLHCEEEPVEESEEPTECQSPPRPVPPPPPPKNKSRLLEIKRANAELFRKCADNTNLEQNIPAVNENIKVLKKNHGRDTVNNVLNTREIDVTQEGTSLISQNQNNMHRVNSTECIHHDSLTHEPKPKTNDPSISSFKRESQQRGRMLSRSESFYEEQIIVPNDVSVQSPKSPEIQDNEPGSLEKWTASVANRNAFSRTSPVPDVKDSNEVCKVDSSYNNCNKSAFENPANVSEDGIQYNTRISFSPEVTRNRHPSNRELLHSEVTTREDWKLDSLGNVDQDQMFQEEKLHKTGRRSGCPSNTIWKSVNPSLNFEDHSSMQMPNNGQWAWSPERKLHPHAHLPKGASQDSMCVEGTILPITRITEEPVLMPFADRRRFFEDNSKPPMSSHIPINLKPNKDFFCPGLPDQPVSQMISDLRRHSIDHTYHPSSPSRQNNSIYSEYCVNHPVDPPLCCSQGGHSSEYIHPMAYGCRVHETCMYCSSDLYPALIKRNLPAGHHTCHCHHHHRHHHQWSRCGDCLCPSQHSTMDDGSSMHGDPWHMRKPLLQEVSMKEWNQPLKINRKCSQSVSELCHYNPGFHHSGPFRPCCEGSDQEWPQYHRTVSSCDLSCDYSPRQVELPSFQEGPPDPGLARGRTYSVSQLNLESVRERRDNSLAKVEERDPPAPTKKKGPPRPPPPNWEKYKERRASHQLASPGLPDSSEKDSVSCHNQAVEAARQRSQSLPMNQGFKNMTEAFSPPSCEELQSGDRAYKLSEFSPETQGSQDFTTSVSPCLDSARVDAHSSCLVSPVDRLQGRTLIGHTLPSESISSLCDQECVLDEDAERLVSTVEGDAEDSDFHPEDASIKPVPTHISGREQVSILDDFQGSYRHFEDEWSTDRESEISIPDRYEFQPISPPPLCGAVSPTSCAAYYNTSAAKAELLNKMKDLTEVQEEGDKATGVVEEEEELTVKKMQLIDSISKKLSVLHEAQNDLQEEIGANTALGCEVGELLKCLCKPNEYDKFRMFIGDLDKVVNLLLSLSGRLARVESVLSSEDPEPSLEEKLSLLEKKKQLTDQLEDAKELKAHVTRREQVVLEVVSRYLNEDQLQDYQHYVKMTSALIVEQRELEDKIRLGEEQLRCLRESL
ncbi:protein Shroom4 isoform X1 [Pelobates fuscus]|uniref:protein Shroom4 isoform X1 n=2 Tax=Pelobates fuscus TaxID=191477 RepID=UPI002FE4C31B